MGQEVGTTGIQMARAMSIIANGGVMVEPRIEAWRPAGDGEVVTNPERVISERTAEATLYAMRDAVTDGTGKKANSPFYDFWGKTGTAQLPKAEGGGYHQDRYVSSFLGGVPVDKPRLVIGCFIKDPKKKHGHYGGVVAAPAVRNVGERSLIYLGVPANPGSDVNERLDHLYEVVE